MNQYHDPKAAALARLMQFSLIVFALGYVDCHAQAQRLPFLDAVSATIRKWVVESDLERPADQYGIWDAQRRQLQRPSTPDAVRALGYESQIVWLASHYGPLPLQARETPWRRAPVMTARSRWVSEIDADCLRPKHWPRNLSWAKREPLCRAMVKRAEALIAGAEPPCEGGPLSHWGGPGDDHRVKRQSDRRSRSYRPPAERWVRAPWRCLVDGKWEYPANRFYCDPRELDCARPEEA